MDFRARNSRKRLKRAGQIQLRHAWKHEHPDREVIVWHTSASLLNEVGGTKSAMASSFPLTLTLSHPGEGT
jgi:hypothetical protein